MINKLEILSCTQMVEAERLAIDDGTPGFALMEKAGTAVAEAIAARYGPEQPIIVLCGPGNNGGDGFIAACRLKELGFTVRVACLVKVEEMDGDAARAAGQWQGEYYSFPDLEIPEDELIVDAVFGTGLARPLAKPVTTLFNRIGQNKYRVIAVDIPTGIDCTTGNTDPHTLEAELTVTFFRKKLGHVLMPAREYCGTIEVSDIGIPDSAVTQAGFTALENNPLLWNKAITSKQSTNHKYDYGHAVILGGTRMTGAACMAAHAAMRAGAGLCTIVADLAVSDIYQSYKPNLLFEPLENFRQFGKALKDPRRNAVLLGPGAGQEDAEGLREALLAALNTEGQKKVILDADALTVFAHQQEVLFSALKANKQAILTPHEGEFPKLFPALTGSKAERAQQAARLSGAVIVLKGADTVIASPDGQCIINTHTSPWLATAGTGDVLAGIILGLAAKGGAPLEAACAGVWVHGEAAKRFGPGLTAPDLPDLLPGVFADFL